MTLSTNNAIQRFGENEERVNKFVNEDGSYTTNEQSPRQVKTLPSFMDEMISRHLSYKLKGDWTTLIVYDVQDLVFNNGVTYVCLVNHTSGVFATDVSAGKWAVYQGATKSDLAADNGSDLVTYKAPLPASVAKPVSFKHRESISLFDVMTPTQIQDAQSENPSIDLTESFLEVVDYFQSISRGYSNPFFTVKLPRADYLILDAAGVPINWNANVLQICFESETGARIIGNGSNKAFDFINGGYRNLFKKITFANFAKVVDYRTNNRNECFLKFEECNSSGNDIFIDTENYSESRSTMIKLSDCLVTGTRVAVRHFTDQLSIENTWIYAKDASYDALLYLSGDGMVSVKDSFMIPNAKQIPNPQNARWIDFVSDSANGTPGDRSIKTLKISNVRMSLESARPFIWTFDNNTSKPNGNNQISSITIEDSYLGGTGGNSVITYKTGYPGSVNLRNVKGLSCPQIVSVDSANTTYPVPSNLSNLTYHAIMIDEATRLAQSNSYNANSLIDPKLEPFCYDTTSQTSKYKRSIPKNIDYRLKTSAAGSGRVKVTIPVFFDSVSEVPSRDILSFLVVTVSDANGPAFSNPGYRSQEVTLVSIIGGNSGSAVKRIVATSLQAANGGIGFGYSMGVSVFWGTGDTGSADIAVNSTSGTEDNITIAWNSASSTYAWAYIVPLAGLRENQQDKMQNGVW